MHTITIALAFSNAPAFSLLSVRAARKQFEKYQTSAVRWRAEGLAGSLQLDLTEAARGSDGFGAAEDITSSRKTLPMCDITVVSPMPRDALISLPSLPCACTGLSSSPVRLVKRSILMNEADAD